MDNRYQTAKIVEIQKENEKVSTFILDASVEARPGQYLLVSLDGKEEKPFGVAQPQPLSMSIARVGSFTEKLHSLNPGDEILFRGPLGTSFTLKDGTLLLIAGGYGVVPLYFLASITDESQRDSIHVILGAKTKDELVYVQKFVDLGVHVHICTDDGSEGYKGFTTLLTEELMEEYIFDAVYTVGPPMMMEKIGEMCKEKGIFCQTSGGDLETGPIKTL